MTFSTLLRGAVAGTLVLLVLAVAGFFAIRESAKTADHPAIHAALVAAEQRDVGLPLLRGMRSGFRVNYYSECVGLSMLLHEHVWTDHGEPGAAAVRADAILPDGTGTMCLLLQNALAEEMSVPWFTYARYWHGSLMLHRAVLSEASYATLIEVATVILAGCGTLLLLAFLRLLPWPAAVTIAVTILALTDARGITGLPLQATCMAAFLAGLAIFVGFGARHRGAGALAVAMAAGAFFNFFDFLYNPSTFAMVCAWSWLAAGLLRGEARRARDGLFVFLAAFGGYGAFWAAKWLIAYGFWANGEPMFIFGTNEFTRWGPAASADYWPGHATVAVVAAAFDSVWKIAVALAIAAAALGLAWWRRRASERGEGFLARYLVLMSPAIPAFAVLEAMAGHTMAHTEFTFRVVPWTLALALAGVFVAARQMTPAARNASISAAP